MCISSHHNSEDMLGACLVVQTIGRVHDTSARIDPEHAHAGRIDAAMDREAQLGTFISIRGFDAQNLRVRRCVL